ncbi:MAG: VOC family protein [Acidobacteriota bacterium]
MSEGFRVEQIDHVEMFVPDRQEAADWYGRVLGFEILEDFRDWAEPTAGPLMVSSDGGVTKLALFVGDAPGKRVVAGFRRVAFRVAGEAFLEFLKRLPELALRDAEGRPVSAGDVSDHCKAWSIYFSDPWGHRLEITTYDAVLVRLALKASSA